MDALQTPWAGECPGDGLAQRVIWEDKLRVWLIEQDDALATSSAAATASDSAG